MDINALKQLPILSVASHLGISLQRAGANYKCCCPFHKEKTPSFFIFTDTNTFKCFGNCVSSGSSVIDLVMNKLSCGVAEACRYLNTEFLHESDNYEQQPIILIAKKKPLVAIANKNLAYWHRLLMVTERYRYFIERGFSISTIESEAFGWDEERYVIPVWEGEPRNSACLSLRLRGSNLSNEVKYLSVEGSKNNTLYNVYCANKYALPFVLGNAGELDARLLTQYGVPAVSTVGGMGNTQSFVDKWPNLWFPNIKFWISLFDYDEAIKGSKLATQWEKVKGRGKAVVVHWNDSSCDDPTEYLSKHTIVELINLIMRQVKIPELYNYLTTWLANYQRLIMV